MWANPKIDTKTLLPKQMENEKVASPQDPTRARKNKISKGTDHLGARRGHKKRKEEIKKNKKKFLVRELNLRPLLPLSATLPLH